jgi:hypothetical protein
MFLMAASRVHADPLVTASIPEDARWVMHLNVDAARGTPLWDMVRTKFVEPQRPQLGEGLKRIEALTGIQLPADLHDVTLYGTAFDEASVCIMIHAPFDQGRIMRFLQLDPEFNSADHNGHAIVTWRDKQRGILMHGSFTSAGSVVVSPNSKVVELALDTLDGKSGALKPESPLAPPALASPAPAAIKPGGDGGNTMVFWIAANSIFDLPRTAKVQSPFIQQMQDASLAVSTLHDRVSARLTVSAKSDKIAQQLTASAEGVKAMINLSAAEDHAPPAAKVLASTLQDLTFATDGKHVTAEWSVGMDKLEAIADIIRTNQAAGSGAAVAPASPILAHEK